MVYFISFFLTSTLFTMPLKKGDSAERADPNKLKTSYRLKSH
jgi:hypothetical protein